MKDHRKYIRCLYVYNKIDGVSLDFLNELAHEPYTAVMSCELNLGVQGVVERIWSELRLIRLYTKRYVCPCITSCCVGNENTKYGGCHAEREKTLISPRP